MSLPIANVEAIKKAKGIYIASSNFGVDYSSSSYYNTSEFKSHNYDA